VIDDAAVIPRHVLGFDAKRGLPIVAKIAMGSLRNKLFILLPATLALSCFPPEMITPSSCWGEAYLCYEDGKNPRSRLSTSGARPSS
jgi:predicted DNA repair protein MutK